MLDEADIAHYRTFGYVRLRNAFESGPLSREFDRSIEEGSRRDLQTRNIDIPRRFVPTLCRRTPVALSLIDRFAPIAGALLGRPVLPLRAANVFYFGSSNWHSDTNAEVTTVAFLCYLEPLTVQTGALRVLPGSHHRPFRLAMHRYCAPNDSLAGEPLDAWIDSVPCQVIESVPGDVVVFDEHLYHGSSGGKNRRQWRLEYVVDPVGAEEEAEVRAHFSRVYPPFHDAGYDVDRYPNFDEHWLESGRPSVERLRQLGAYEAAAAEERFIRSCTARAG